MGIVVKKKDAPDAGVEATITTTHKDGGVVEEKEHYPTPAVLEGPPVVVGVNVGITRNLGNYESIKVSVSLSVPCAPDGDEIEETYNQAKNWVDSKINTINEEINENLS